MLQTAFGASCMNRAWVFEWHKRFKEGRESVRDDERYGRSKEVRTPELIGQIKNFMDKDRRVSIETISSQFDVSVGTVHTIIRKELKMQKICAKFVPRVLREDQKERRCYDSREMVELINSDPWCSGDLRWKLDLLLWPRDQETEFPAEAWWLSQTQEGQTEQIHSQTFDDPFFDNTGMIYMHWVPTGQTVNKEYYVEVLREFRKRFHRKRPALFPWGQCTSPQLHPCHRLFDQDGHQDSFSASLLTRPCSLWLWLFPKRKEKLRGCRYETIEEMKEGVTKVIDTLTQEDFHGERYDKCIAAEGDFFEGG